MGNALYCAPNCLNHGKKFSSQQTGLTILIIAAMVLGIAVGYVVHENSTPGFHLHIF